MPSLENAVKAIQTRGFSAFAGASYNHIVTTARRKLFGTRFVTRKVNDYKMILDNNDPGISRSLILFGTREVDHKVIIEKVLKPGMRVFDIGANIGYYVLMERGLVGEDGEIIAIEPSPTNAKLLQKNLALNGYDQSNVTFVEGGVSDKPGVLNFHLAEMSNLHTFHPKGSAAEKLTGEVIEVKTYSMPELVDLYGAPDLLRMDVEGHEVDIFKGMLEDVEAGKYAPMICFEPHISCYNEEHDFAPILERLFKAGYKTQYLSSNAQSGTDRIAAFGYEPAWIVPSDGEARAIFEDVSPEDTIKILTETGGARTVLLGKP